VEPPAEIVAARRPWFVVVTGEPGSGKTTLGRHVAAALRLPFLSRDQVRGGLLASAGLWTNRMRPKPEREAARATFIDIAATVAGFGVSAVLELVLFNDVRASCGGSPPSPSAWWCSPAASTHRQGSIVATGPTSSSIVSRCSTHLAIDRSMRS
jgi:hypothetical protein